MSTILEDMGAVAQWFFVPSAVIESQTETQKMLEARAEKINGNPNILATAKTDKNVATTLQNMNRDVYLSSQRDRETGQAVLQAFYDSVEEIPSNLKKAVSGAGEAAGSFLSGGIPVWLRWLLGVALFGAILYFLTRILGK